MYIYAQRLVMVVCCSGVFPNTISGANPIDLLQVVNAPNAPFDERVAAEKELLNSVDLSVLDSLFHILDEGIGDRWTSPFPAIGMYPGLPFPEGNKNLPVGAQIVYARLRLWDHFARNAEPEAERKRNIADLFDEFDGEFQFRQLISAAKWNHSPELEQKLWDIFADREHDASVRIASASTLSQITHLYARANFGQYSRRIIEYAWEERGSEVATTLGGRGGGHPLQNALMLDWYDRERNPETRRSRISMEDLADRIDRAFDNITGLYEQRTGTVSDKALAIVHQRNALREEARATGDDTKLREFEAELAERQRQELETRFERIDAWVAANRERLEQEAIDYERRRQDAMHQ